VIKNLHIVCEDLYGQNTRGLPGVYGWKGSVLFLISCMDSERVFCGLERAVDLELLLEILSWGVEPDGEACASKFTLIEPFEKVPINHITLCNILDGPAD
jgi:hypothetical protein